MNASLKPTAAPTDCKVADLGLADWGRKEILIAGGDCLTGHDPETGAELWRWGTWNPRKIGHWRLVPSPVAGGGVVLAVDE